MSDIHIFQVYKDFTERKLKLIPVIPNRTIEGIFFCGILLQPKTDYRIKNSILEINPKLGLESGDCIHIVYEDEGF